MTYKQAIDYLYNSCPVFHFVGTDAYKPGLDNIRTLLTHLGNPHSQLRTVHIAGTNGKGSTSHLMAACLQAAGLRVGLYTSPHLIDFSERIRINGKSIEHQFVADFIEQHQSLLSALQPSFFETTTAMAFCYFAQQNVDIAIIETGLGGRLDATNVITPLISVITNIGLDHTDLLGNTLADIAREKAGIIKDHVPCVIGETTEQTKHIFIETAKTKGIYGTGLETTDCQLFFADQCGYLRRVRQSITPDCELKGSYQQQNMQTAFVALRLLNNIWPYCTHCSFKDAIQIGYQNVCQLTGLRGRWECKEINIDGKQLTFITDTGHNAHGLQYVMQQLRELSHTTTSSVLCIMGTMRDKDITSIINLLPSDFRYFFTQAHTPRALLADQLLQIFNTHKKGTAKAYPSVESALQAAINHSNNGDIIFIGGSNYIVGEYLKLEATNYNY